jgi:hypothetical protein
MVAIDRSRLINIIVIIIIIISQRRLPLQPEAGVNGAPCIDN